MKKETIKKDEILNHQRVVESVPENDLWENLNPDTRMVLEEISEKLVPYGLARVETGTTDKGIVFATVKKTSDKSIIYYTEIPSEVKYLKNLEIIPL